METNIENEEGERMPVMMYILLPACFSIHHMQKKYADSNGNKAGTVGLM
jgi:hypothetical protein